jgi:hypothetical protein
LKSEKVKKYTTEKNTTDQVENIKQDKSVDLGFDMEGGSNTNDDFTFELQKHQSITTEKMLEKKGG